MPKLQVTDINLLPTGVPLEKPLHQPKRRRLLSPYIFATKDHHQIDASMGEAGEVSRVPAEESLAPRELQVDVVVEQADELYIKVEAPSVPSSAPSIPPVRPAPRRPLKDVEMDNIINYGSDSDSDYDNEDDDEEVGIPLSIPRTARILMETPEDEPSSLTVPPTQSSMPLPPSSSPSLPTRPPVRSNEGSSWSSDPFYSFNWEPFPNPPIPPESRREIFSNTNCGPTTPCVDPYDVFVSIWDRNFMETIASETNKFSQQLVEQMMAMGRLCPSSRICDWKDTTPDELYVYFGIVLAMGVVVKSRIHEYWSNSCDVFITPGFHAHMPLKRFQLLSRCLHFADNSDMCAGNLSPSEARLFKIAPIIAHLNHAFQSMYSLRQNIALDESLLQWKGLLQINQFVPNKVAAVGIKSYELCESQTGYLWRFIIHAHSAESKSSPMQDPLTSTTPALVLQILDGLEHKGHTVWMDNFYNSPILARKLKALGFDCVGTLRTNRLFVPEEMRLKKSQMVAGQVIGVTSGDVDLMVWRDQNCVATISTYHGNAVSTDSEGTTKPILIRDYNVMMGGVDKKDQLLSSYPVERKRTRVWYKKLFRRLLNVSVLNSYIIHKSSGQNSKTNALTHRNFRIALIKRLLSHVNTAVSVPPIITSNVVDARVHYPCEFSFLPRGTSRLRRVCCICRKRTTSYCAGCDKAACVFTCFKHLHK